MEWQYENEWRLIFSGIYTEDTNIVFPAISAIYLCAKIENQNRERIVEMASNMKIDMYDMKLENNEVLFKEINRRLK